MKEATLKGYFPEAYRYLALRAAIVNCTGKIPFNYDLAMAKLDELREQVPENQRFLLVEPKPKEPEILINGRPLERKLQKPFIGISYEDYLKHVKAHPYEFEQALFIGSDDVSIGPLYSGSYLGLGRLMSYAGLVSGYNHENPKNRLKLIRDILVGDGTAADKKFKNIYLEHELLVLDLFSAGLVRSDGSIPPLEEVVRKSD